MKDCTARALLRRLVKGSLAAPVFAIAVVPIGHTQVLGPLVQVTGPDPFASCTSDRVSQQETTYGSTLYLNTAIEPWVAVEPTNPSRLLVGHQQDRWSDGGARGDIDAISNDGGGTWTNPLPANPPDVTACTGGKALRASDPWVAFANDGTAFFMSLFFDPAKPTTPFGGRKGGMLMSRSTDHGATWSGPIALITNNSPHVLDDKNSVTADPTDNGLVYAVWDELSVFPHTVEGAALLGQNDGVAIARDLLHSAVGSSAVCAPFNKPPCKGGAPVYKFNYTGPSLLSMTTNNGLGWSKPTTIVNTGTNQQTINNLVQVRPNGDVYDFFTAIGKGFGPTELDIGFVKSLDKGVLWSAPAFATDIQVAGVVTPDAGQAVRDASILFAVSVNPVSGAIYLTLQDDRFSTANCITPGTPSPGIPIDSIAFSQSADGGATWSTPVMINKTPVNAANPCRQQAFIPAVVATGDGKTVAVTYYDFRNDANTPAGFEATDYFAVFCSTSTDCSNPANWGAEQRLTAASFNILDAPVAGGHFLGDYMGLAASGPTTVYPVFGVTTGHNMTADFTRKISGLP